MPIKNIIWDWNGTIINDAWLFVEIMNSILEKNSLPPTSLKKYRKHFCFPIQKYWRHLGFRFTDETFARLNDNFIHKYQQKMFLPDIHDGMIELFEELKEKKIRQFVLSATENSLLIQAVDYYHLRGFFDGVYGVDNLNAVGKEKTGAALCEKHQLDKNLTLIVGDTEYDYVVGKSLGCNILLVSHGHINHKRLLKTKVSVVGSVEELKKWLSLF